MWRDGEKICFFVYEAAFLICDGGVLGDPLAVGSYVAVRGRFEAFGKVVIGCQSAVCTTVLADGGEVCSYAAA